MKIALFDCDGTLVDSLAIIHAAMCFCFEEVGIATPQEVETRSIIGLTLDTAIATILDRPIDDQINQMVVSYKEHYRVLLQSGKFDAPLYPRISETLAELHKIDHLLMGVVTGKSRRGLDNIIAENNFGQYFITSRTADECPSKPNPAMVLECCSEAGIDAKDAVVIGDTTYDMEMGKAAGAATIGVDWGYHNSKQLKSSGADVIISSADELIKLLR
jgi:phosphoglycolate phosphatase